MFETNTRQPDQEPDTGFKHNVPDVLLDQGLYQIRLVQGEMYDLGNIDNVTHHILYDRATGVALDVTAEIEPAPLLSATQPAQVLDDENIKCIENLLSGRIKPDPSTVGPLGQGISVFEAREIEPDFVESLRAHMLAIRTATSQLRSAREAFDSELKNLPPVGQG